jgi:hypothetical protein
METYDKDWLERASAGATDNVLSTGMATRLSDGIKGLEAQLATTRAGWVKSCKSNGADHNKLWTSNKELKTKLESIQFICEANIGFGERMDAIAEDILGMLGEE